LSTVNSSVSDIYPLKIDIISIGSLSRSDFQSAQERTFGSHAAVQNFFRITERNDTDQDCSSKLKTPQLQAIVRFCNTQFPSADLISNWLRKRLKPFRYSRQSTGWLCAQKRPIDGLHIVLNRYKENMDDIPDYVAIVDDDSYLNMEPFLAALSAYNNSDRDGLHALTGCVFDMLPNMRFTFPHGGFGSILSRNVILKLMRPIHCSKKQTLLDGYSKMACWRLEQNHLNEKQYFKEGMSLLDLMHTYLKRLSFLNSKRWKDGHGYCLHSDHTFGYFFGFYHVTLPDSILEEAELSDDVRRGGLSTYTTLGEIQQCFNENDLCSNDDLICHYIKPEQMDRMYDAVHSALDVQAAVPSSSEISSPIVPRTIKPVIDIISIGTLLKPELQDAQQRTFGSHSSIRNFFRITELNDTDLTCPTNLTMAQWHKIYDFCTDLTNQTHVSSMVRQRVYKPKNHTGWMCAQKRPLDGLYFAIQQYTSTSYETSLPDYLIVADDDTYANMDYLVNNIPAMYPTFEAHIVTGCRIIHPKNIHFSFPFGGFGTIITRKAIENLIQPIFCRSSHGDADRLASAFNQMACWRLNQNLVGEKSFFRDGMSVLDLIYAYSSGLMFSQVDNWANGVGFCFHSDHALGYFFGFYHIAVPEAKWSEWEYDLSNKHQQIDMLFNDSLREEYGYANLIRDGVVGCRFRGNRCNAMAPFCHYIQPDQMDTLYAEVSRTAAK
jgi:Fringe-like